MPRNTMRTNDQIFLNCKNLTRKTSRGISNAWRSARRMLAVAVHQDGGVRRDWEWACVPLDACAGSSTVTSCSTLRKCELLPGGRIYFARCTHIVSFTPGKPWPNQATPRPRVDCHDWPTKQARDCGVILLLLLILILIIVMNPFMHLTPNNHHHSRPTVASGEFSPCTSRR